MLCLQLDDPVAGQFGINNNCRYNDCSNNNQAANTHVNYPILPVKINKTKDAIFVIDIL